MGFVRLFACDLMGGFIVTGYFTVSGLVLYLLEFGWFTGFGCWLGVVLFVGFHYFGFVFVRFGFLVCAVTCSLVCFWGVGTSCSVFG